MKKHLLITLCLTGLWLSSRAQQVYPGYQDGTVLFKIENTSEVVLPDYNQSDTGTYPFMDSLISRFGITRIHRLMINSSRPMFRRFYQVNFDSVSGVDTLIDLLSQYNFIQYAEKVSFCEFYSAPAPNDPKLVWQWAFKKIMADSLWHLLDSGGKEIKIAVIDDAVLTTHEDMQDVVLPGWDMADNDANVNPPVDATETHFSHGTCVASVAGARTNNNTGISSMNLNNRIKIIPLKIADDLSGNATTSTLITAVEKADSLGADIISISLGILFNQTLYDMIDSMSDRLFVVATGNDGDSTYNYPASYNLPNIISVGGSNQYDEKTAFSNYNKYVDVVAPATGILGASAAGNDHYGYKMGTSYSTPLVSGLCALLWSRDSTLTLAQVIDRVKDASDDISHINPQYTYQLGAGRINALRTLYPSTPDYFAGFHADSSRQLCIGDTLSFTAKTYTGIAYHWDFGNGTTVTTYTPNVSAIYHSAGLFHPSLALTDSITGDTLAYERYEGYVSVGECNASTGLGTNWIFGKYGSIGFDNGYAEPKNDILTAGTLWSIGATVTENDPVTGDLIYYAGFDNTNDQFSINSYIKVWNPDHSLSATLNGKTGQGFQSLVSIPLNGKYLLFANSTTSPHLHYYVITPVSGGVDADEFPNPVKVGAVTGFSDTASDGALRVGVGFTVIPGCTPNEYWLIVQASDNSPAGYKTQMLVIKVQNNSGVISALLHQVYDMPTGFDVINELYLVKASVDGNWIARSNYGKKYEESSTTDLFTFDRNTGTMTHKYRLAHGGRGISFSPDSKKLYVGDLGAIFYQYNLEDYDPEQSAMPVPVEFNHIIMQTGPDGKLYITGQNTDTISVIAHPNHLNSLDSQNNCGFDSRGLQLAEGTQSINGFPNFIDAKTASNLDLDFTVRQTGCRQYSFYPNKFCPAAWYWKFGDDDTSTSKEPTHSYASSGVYTVKLFHDGDSVEKTVYVGAGFYGDTLSCDTSEIYTYYYPHNELFDYKWTVTNGELVGGTDSSYKIQVKFHGTGTVKLVLNDPRIPCLDSVTATVHYGINTDSVFSDTVFLQTPPAFIGCGFDVSGTISYDLNPHYTWLLSEDLISWDTAGSDSSGFIALFEGDPDTLWLTRSVTTACFSSFGDTVLVTNQMSIYQQPQDFASCDGQIFVNIGISNPLDLPYTIGWEADSSANWIELTAFTDTFVESSSPLGSRYRALLSYGACTIYSDTADYLSATDSAINTISLDSGACFPGAALLITGDSAFINGQDSIISYQWQKWDSMGWQNTSWADTLMSFDGTTEYDSTYYRRKIFSQWCENYSDSILVAPKIRITRHPDDVSKCVGDGDAVKTFHIGTEFTDSWQPYKAYFVVKKFIDIIGYVYVVEDSTDYLTYPTMLDSIEYGLGHFTYEYFFKISTPCGFYHSDTALLHGCYAENPDDWTVTMPDTVYTTEGSLVTLVTHYDPCNSGPYLEGSYTYWQHSNNGSDWYTLNDTCGDTLRFTASYCDNGFYYRMAYYDPCYEQERYSPVGRLFVTRTNFADLMMRDYYNDDGTERNSTTTWPQIYETPDLWIRLSADNDTNHQKANYPGPVYVYYRIKNRGTDTSRVADLYMHWTLGGPNGQDWPIAWTYNSANRFTNTDAGSAFYNKVFPLGGPINEIAISVPPLAPNEELVDYFVWDSIPNPYWYSGFTGTTTRYPDSLLLCLLSRIHTCELDSFGLYRKEITWTRTNIENNNNIIGRNTKVTNMDAVMQLKKSPQYVRTYDSTKQTIGVEIREVNNCGFSSYAKLNVVLENPLWNAWTAGGHKGHDYLKISDNMLRVTDVSNFTIRNMNLDIDSGAFMTLEYEMTAYPLTKRVCRFEISQYYEGDSTVKIGGFVNTVLLQPEPEGGGDGDMVVVAPDPLDEVPDENAPAAAIEEQKVADEKQQADPSKNEQVVDQIEVKAYPNPFSTEVTFEVTTPKEVTIGFELYNALGAQVGVIETKEYAKGKTTVSFNASHLAPGMYLCKVQIGDATQTIRLVIVR